MTEQKPTLLYADDEPPILRMATRILKDKYDLLITTDCVQAYNYLRGNDPPKYAVLDNIFKGQQFEGIAIIEKLFSERGRLPSGIVLCSGTLDSSIRRRAEARGAKCIDKPFSPGDLLGILSSFS
ncbi:response regulator [Candidatus Woesearchaeota archaeon]|nr:response regulator [Candidatus Woesearchaeota archaeon]